MAECPLCATAPKHTEKFEKLLSTVSEELKRREIPGIDAGELSMTLAVLVADSLGIDIYA